MSILKQVGISGTIGIQVFPTTRQVLLRNAILDAGAVSAAVLTIRQKNASGEVVLICRQALAGTLSVPLEGLVRFDGGMHVKVTGVGATAYLELE